jgi:hypothetical protein
MTTSPPRVSTSLALLALATGCSFLYGDDIDHRQCTTQADCDAVAIGSPLVCRMNTCQLASCLSSAQCPEGSECVASTCTTRAPPDSGMSKTACTQDSDCGTGNRCGFDNFCYEKWGCLDDDRDWPKSSPSFSYRIAVRKITDLEFREPASFPELDVVACAAIDPACNTPVVRRGDVQLSDDKTVSVPFTGIGNSGFNGFIRFAPVALTLDGGVAQDGGTAQPFLPTYLHFSADNPLVASTVAQSRLLTIDETTFGFLATVAEVKLDLTQATIALRIHDCGGRTAPGVSMVARGVTSATFVPIQNESVPIVGGTKTAFDGSAIIINVPPRNHTFVLHDEDVGRTIADQVAFLAVGNAVNYFFYYPRFKALEAWNQQARAQGLLQ